MLLAATLTARQSEATRGRFKVEQDTRPAQQASLEARALGIMGEGERRFCGVRRVIRRPPTQANRRIGAQPQDTRQLRRSVNLKRNSGLETFLILSGVNSLARLPPLTCE